VSIYYHHNNITSILYCYQKVNIGRPWAPNASPGCCQRHARVLDPLQSVAQMGCLSEWSFNPNPFRNNARSTIRSYVTRRDRSSYLRTRFAGFSPVEYEVNRVPTPPSCRQSARLYHAKQQKDGGQPGSGGCGVPTTRSRHPRREVLDPGQSMNPGWIMGRWSGDQNLIDWYAVGKQSSCDILSPYIGSPPSGHPLRTQSRHQEVGR